MKDINSVFIKTNFTYTGPLRYIVTIAIFFTPFIFILNTWLSQECKNAIWTLCGNTMEL